MQPVMQMSTNPSPLRAHLQLMARYNLWATKRLFAHVDLLPDEAYRRDVHLFFKSIHGTLNHLLVGEHLLWHRRFAEGVSPRMALDHEAEPDRALLRQRLHDGALAWLPLLEVWPESRLLGSFDYHRANGEPVTAPFAATLLHVFNHGTHHRGQISAALSMLGHRDVVLDLMYMLIEESQYA
jgi:uncharacterized damage-inducible protein DinB